MYSSAVAALLAFVAAAQAQDYYKWNGLSTDFNQDKLWSGPVPGADGDIPLRTTIGSQEKTTVTSLPKGNTYRVGSKLTLLGNTKLFLGDGRRNSKTTISFEASDAANPTPTTFSTDFSFENPKSTLFDYQCNLNWLKVVDGKTTIPDSPPCKSDNVLIPDGAYYIDIYDSKAGASKIRVGNRWETSVPYLSSCQDYTTIEGTAKTIGKPVFINLHSKTVCTKQFNFLTDGSAQFQACDVSTCSAREFETDDGETIKVFTDGERKGQVFTVDENGDIKNITKSAKITVDDDDKVTKIEAKNLVINGDGNLVTTAPTMSPTKPAEASTSAAGGSTIFVIIGVAVAALVIVIGIVVFVVLRLKQSSNGVDERNIVSFENPMYDDVEKANPGFDDDDNGIYDDPEMAQEDTAGYMDVPANSGNDSSGYMDVPAAGNNGGGSGYMDVAPNEDDDDFDEDDDDNEDI